MNAVNKKTADVIVSKDEIKAGLIKLGLESGDSVGVHSSLSSFGYVDGGANAVVDALLEVVGECGTIAMPTYSANLAKVEKTPEEIAIGVLWIYRILPYDPKETPCTTGTIPEAFRKRKGVLRSVHHVFSLAALGPHAQEIIDAGYKDSRQGWKKLLELEGHILLLGVGLENCSAMHLAEERVTLPKHISDKVTAPKWFVDKYPPNEWEWDFGPYPDFAKLEEPCIERGIMKTVKVGKATLKLVKLRELIDLYVEYLKTSPDLFYHI